MGSNLFGVRIVTGEWECTTIQAAAGSAVVAQMLPVDAVVGLDHAGAWQVRQAPLPRSSAPSRSPRSRHLARRHSLSRRSPLAAQQIPPAGPGTPQMERRRSQCQRPRTPARPGCVGSWTHARVQILKAVWPAPVCNLDLVPAGSSSCAHVVPILPLPTIPMHISNPTSATRPAIPMAHARSKEMSCERNDIWTHRTECQSP